MTERNRIGKLLEDVLKSYKERASVINWKSYSINDLFFKTIEHEKEPDYENWYAGIICRTWGYAGRVYTQCNKHLPFDQCYEVLMEAIDYVLRKRVWENPKSSLYQDPVAPDKAFHVALRRQRDVRLKKLNAHKRQANFNTLSIDAAHEDYNDAAEGLLDIGDVSSEEIMDNVSLVDYIGSKDMLHILMLDQVCFNDWKTLGSVVTNLRELSADDFSYYQYKYGADEKQFTKAIRSIKMVSRKTLLSELKKILYIANKEVFGGKGR